MNIKLILIIAFSVLYAFFEFAMSMHQRNNTSDMRVIWGNWLFSLAFQFRCRTGYLFFWWLFRFCRVTSTGSLLRKNSWLSKWDRN